MPEMNKTEIIEQLKKFISERCLNKPGFELEPAEPLISSGLLKSIHLVELAVFIENTYGIYVPDTEFTTQDVNTLDSMAEVVLKYSE